MPVGLWCNLGAQDARNLRAWGAVGEIFLKGKVEPCTDQRKRMVVGARGGWVDQVAGALGLPGLDLVPERQARCAEPPREPEALVRVGKEGFPRGCSMEAGPAPFLILHAHATRGRSPLLPLCCEVVGF